MPISATTFSNHLLTLLAEGERLGFVAVDVNAGRLHRMLGDYPGKDHRMPVCCAEMRRAMNARDEVVKEPPSGDGASLTIRYQLPRLSSAKA